VAVQYQIKVPDLLDSIPEHCGGEIESARTRAPPETVALSHFSRRGVRSPRLMRSELYQSPDEEGEVNYYDPKADKKSTRSSGPKFSMLDANKKTNSGAINQLLPDADKKPDAGKTNRQPKTG
jgi:hypothetical protein